jgi:hypothetical protein
VDAPVVELGLEPRVRDGGAVGDADHLPGGLVEEVLEDLEAPASHADDPETRGHGGAMLLTALE